ncbi:YhgE/Pip domain-containing protein [Paenibacillus thiaminolyticus]|uniref:YhgE/Pip domain-containing protein n=1 Tax=Paenibacillus thiaminolyticus TaxID=49283 RepID=UPI002542BF55|nr:YhgE/Pip domain-containing protein [Paenibacillus thiaminolyticus]WII37249.1 YhgE/Pip domain-containing protein [Paenibacillus thiaminolyticus]
MNILKIYITDLRNIIKNPAAIIVILAVVILPSLYAWFNILPSWDPYANTKDVAVAVVNLDKGAEVQDKSIDVGGKVVESLKENDKLGWRFVDKEDAMEGVNHGDYYAAIVIPEDFSEKITSVISSHPEKAELDYYINEKVNAIAPKVTSAGATGVTSTIRSNFVKEANGAIFDIFNEIGVELEGNKPSILKMKENLFKLEENIPEIESMIRKGQVDLIKADDIIKKAETALSLIKDFEKEKKDAVDSDVERLLDKGDETFEKTIPTVKKDLQALQNTMSEMSAMTDAINSNLDLRVVEQELRKKSDEVNAGIWSLQQLITRVESVNHSLTTGGIMNDMISSLYDMRNKLEDLNNQLEKARRTVADNKELAVDKLKEIQRTAIKINELIGQFRTDLDNRIVPALTKALNDVEQAGKRYRDQVTQVQDLIKKAKDQLAQADGSTISEKWKEIAASLSEAASQLENSLGSLDKLIEKVEEISKLTGTDYQWLIDMLNNMKTNAGSLQELLDKINKELENNNVPELVSSLIGKFLDKAEIMAGQLADSYDNVIAPGFKTTRSNIEKLMNEAREKSGKLQDAAVSVVKLTDKLLAKDFNKVEDQLRNAAARTKDGQNAITKLIDVAENMKRSVDDGAIEDVIAKLRNIESRMEDVSNALIRASDFAGDANKPTKDTLTQISSVTKDAAASIDDAVETIDKDVVPAFHRSMEKSREGLEFVRKIENELFAAIPKIESALAEVKDKVRLGETELNKVNGEFPELSRKVRDIASKIRSFEETGDLDEVIKLLTGDAEQESDFFAEPVLLKEHELFPIPNYGSAMSPFFTTLALWVGGLLLISMLIVDIENKHEYKSYEAYFGRLLTFVTLGIGQATIVTLGDMFLLKTYVLHKFWFVLFGVYISIIFVTIVYTLVSVFGNVGKALSIVLLVFQLASSGGTFPIQMTPAFFQKLHPFLPFTHAITIMREAVGGILWPVVTKHMLILLIYIGIAFVLGVGLKKTINKSSDKFLQKAKKSKLL